VSKTCPPPYPWFVCFYFCIFVDSVCLRNWFVVCKFHLQCKLQLSSPPPFVWSCSCALSCVGCKTMRPWVRCWTPVTLTHINLKVSKTCPPNLGLFVPMFAFLWVAIVCVILCKLQKRNLERVNELHQPRASPLELSKTYLPPYCWFVYFWDFGWSLCWASTVNLAITYKGE